MSDHVLITGGAGFIGSRLARRFFEGGHQVTVLDSLIAQVHGDDPERTSPLLRSLDGVAEVLRGSVTSFEDLHRAVRSATVILHLAAETGTGQSMYEIDRYVQTNVGGTAKLLNILSAEPHSVRRVVLPSSRSIYGEGAYRTTSGAVVFPPQRSAEQLAVGDFEVRWPGEPDLASIPTGEDAKLHPSSVYGITKQTQESLVLTCAPTLGIEPVVLRYQNVYGPGQSLNNPYTGILSIFSNLIRQRKSINVFEDGRESRDFVFVDDVVEATYRAALAERAAGEVLNVGSGTATSVSDVVQTLFRAFGTSVPVVVSGQFRVGDIRHNTADTTRMREILDFSARTSFEEGIRLFAAWAAEQPLEVGAYERSLEELTERKLLT